MAQIDFLTGLILFLEKQPDSTLKHVILTDPHESSDLVKSLKRKF